MSVINHLLVRSRRFVVLRQARIALLPLFAPPHIHVRMQVRTGFAPHRSCRVYRAEKKKKRKGNIPPPLRDRSFFFFFFPTGRSVVSILPHPEKTVFNLI